MNTAAVFGIAFALAMDAFAVSIAAGVTLKQVNLRHTVRLAWHFGLFQFAMPVIGWGAGSTVRSFIESYDHWIAFILLLFVGGNMLREAFQSQELKPRGNDPTTGMSLVLLSVATSIDALAVGLSFSLLNISIWFPAIIIGLVAALCTGAGINIGKRLGTSSHIGNYADMTGGLVLIAIGFKILYDHGALDRLL
jgi:manganese efflux pump family protein